MVLFALIAMLLVIPCFWDVYPRWLALTICAGVSLTAWLFF